MGEQIRAPTAREGLGLGLGEGLGQGRGRHGVWGAACHQSRSSSSSGSCCCSCHWSGMAWGGVCPWIYVGWVGQGLCFGQAAEGAGNREPSCCSRSQGMAKLLRCL